MRTEPRVRREALTEEQRDKTKWPTVDTASLDSKDVPLFERRRAAIGDYVDGKSYRAIAQVHEISRNRLWILRGRFFAKHEDGRMYGERALVPRVRIKKYERRADLKARPAGARGGNSGALAKLFERFPEIKEFIDDLFLKRRKPGVVHESRIPVKAIHKRFLDKCRAAGITSSYPFSTKWLGIRALGKYLVRLAHAQTERAITARYGANAARRYEAVGEGMSATRPYQCTQFDGHKIDGEFTIRVKHPHVGEIPVTCPRIWLLAIIDVFSRAVLGYLIVLRLEYRALDVTRCVQRAVAPWKPRAFTIPGLRYPERGGFPSGVFPQLGWAAWDEFGIDNAKANLADVTLDALVSRMGSKVNAGAVGLIERRAIIERLFLTFEENGIHRLPSTTGSNPKDPRRQKPDKAALRYDIRLEHLEDLVEVIFAQYNTTPHAALGYRTPLEVIEHYFATGGEVRRLDEADRNDSAFLYIRDTRTVRGDLKKSRKPYIEYEYGIYRNEVLARSPDLIGTQLVLHVNPDDMRCIKAFLPNGTDLGVLTVQAPWNRTSHSLETRIAVNDLRNRKMIVFTEMDDPVQIYHEHLGREALVKKRARPRYEKHRRELETATSLPTASTLESKWHSETAVQATPRRTVTY
mgnify:CR=1 FL=1